MPAIAGATSTARRATTRGAEAAGHKAVALSRATGLDLRTGHGLHDSLAGIDAVTGESHRVQTTARKSPRQPFSSADSIPPVTAHNS